MVYAQTLELQQQRGRQQYQHGQRVAELAQSQAAGESAGVLRALWPIALIDLPFSIVADTLILPYTLYQDSKANK